MLEEKASDGNLFKKVDKKTLKVQTDIVNVAIKYFKSKNIRKMNDLIKSVGSRTDTIEEKILQGKNEPGWKRKIEEVITKLRQDVNLLTRDLKGELGSKNKQKIKELYEEYRVKKKGLKNVIEKLKQRMLAKSTKVKDMIYTEHDF